MFNSFKVVGLLASIALVTGCVGAPEGTADEENPVTTADSITPVDQTLLAPGSIRIQTGTCNGDGMVIKNGLVYRLGKAVARDVTAISRPLRTLGAGPVCHNTAVWQEGATYMCNMNQGGNRDEAVAPFSEYVNGSLMQHPAGAGQDGLFFAYVDVAGPCNTPSKLDYALDHIECCMNPATPK